MFLLNVLSLAVLHAELMLILNLILLIIRAELTAVHSSVLQQELDSCRLLLEEEPDNKCKCSDYRVLVEFPMNN